ncbi:MAG: DegV family protein [Clostridia bacterium]|nr:DegV family protein [Clostridia bacterium]
MENYVIATCSTADISLNHMLRIGVEYVKFSYFLNDVEYKDDLGQTMSHESFYQKLSQGCDSKTTQPNMESYKEFLYQFLNEGRDVILLNLSSGISGAQASAKIAEKELKSEFPERKIYIVDSLGASSGMGLLVDKMAELRKEGMGIDDLYAWTEKNKLRVQHWFFSTDLTFYVKGGRVSRVAGWFGTILKICPLLTVDKKGKLVPKEKIRGKSSVIRRIVDKMEENAINGLGYNGKCFISHSDCYEDAQEVKRLVEERFPFLDGRVLINNIGTTIGSHTGPGTVALFFFGKERVE